jgi:hypothetical protein
MLKINACPSTALFNPNWFFNSSRSQPLKISSSANPTPKRRQIAFINVFGDIVPIQFPHFVQIIGIKIRVIMIIENKKPFRKKINKFIFLSILLIPSNFQVLLTPQRNLNHFGKEKRYKKKVKIVPIKERFSLSTPNKKIGVAKIHPQMYKKGINIMVDNSFGFKKNKPK